ncbi:MAG: hypothetical protein DME02_14235 [Candidatus Rokuibacteriota bacterium]|nr:MAG: hypothetical protein DME02_14235 [Candidatus Rokubacteria bacterium]
MSTELLKRADFLPRHAEARRLRPGILTDQPTEEYVVTTHPFAAHLTTRSSAGFAGAILFFGEAGRSTAKPCDRRRGARPPPPS